MAKSILKDIYAYIVSLIAFMMLLGSGTGLITGVLEKWVNIVDGDPNQYYYDTSYMVSNCVNTNIDFRTCVKNQIDINEKSYIESKARWQSQLNENLAIMIPMLLISFIVFYFHWGMVRKD